MLAAGRKPAVTGILVVNAGSSSLKLRVLGEGDWLAGSADLPAPRGTVDAAELESALLGHRSRVR